MELSYLCILATTVCVYLVYTIKEKDKRQKEVFEVMMELYKIEIEKGKR